MGSGATGMKWSWNHSILTITVLWEETDLENLTSSWVRFGFTIFHNSITVQLICQVPFKNGIIFKANT